MAASTPAPEKTPTANHSANQPESGTYGEKADLNRLKAELPPMAPGKTVAQDGGPAPMPQTNPQMPPQPGGRPTGGPPGVPQALLGEGNVPSPATEPNAPRANPQAARLSLLEQLASSQEVSETTREWAKIVLEALRG